MEGEEKIFQVPVRYKGEVKYAQCSAIDFDEINKYRWNLRFSRYAFTYNRKLGNMTMHQFVVKNLMRLEVPFGSVVDHISGCGLDNRRENLRVCTRAQNSQNRSKSSTATSKYYGVSSRQAKFYAHLRINGKYIGLGTFDKEEDAAVAYDRYLAAHKDYGTPAQLGNKFNFPERVDFYRTQPYELPQKTKTRVNKYAGIAKTREKKYYAYIRENGKMILILLCDNEEDAAKARDDYIVSRNIKSMKLNFPQRYPDFDYRKVKTGMVDVDETTVRILISNDPEAICYIDRDDYDRVKFSLTCLFRGYVDINFGGQTLKLHRFLLNLPRNTEEVVDHINSNPLDNRKANLRITDRLTNSQNKSKARNATSDYYGVHKNLHYWRASLTVKGRRVLEKRMKTEEEAARLRDMYILRNLPGSGYKMNFQWTEEDKEHWAKKFSKLIKTREEEEDDIIRLI